ncbi:MAG: hypothetical protein GY788_29670, partial [bacterium]|nr:hypothetical protein [bacterium]
KSVFRKYKEVESSAIFAWRGGYLSEAALVAYERTGQRRFLDLFVDYFQKVLKKRDDVLGRHDEYHQRVVKSWGEYRPVTTWFGPVPMREQQWMAHITHAARIALAPAKFARIVAADPDLADYVPTADAFVTAVQEALDEFGEDCITFEGLEGCWYARPMTDGPEATNHIHTLASVLIHFAALDGADPERTGQINRIVDIFETGVVTAEDDTVHWKYFPY